MKTLFKTIVIVLVCFFSVSSCGSGSSEDGPSATDLAFEKLAGQWALGASGRILLDDIDVSNNYTGFALSFTDDTYTTTNAAELFRASGTWEWADQEAGRVILDGLQEVNIVTLTESRFIFSFNFTTGNDRPVRAGFNGFYEITMNK